MRSHPLACVAVALASLFIAPTARADLISLNVNSALSSLTLSGSAYGLTFAEQVAGSLTASYSGTIKADLSGGVFTFSGGSAINALPSGPYTTAPNPITGIEMGNYGVTATGLVAGFEFAGPQTVNGVYRDIVLDLSAGTASNGAATTATFTLTSGALDYGSALDSDTSSVAGESAANASASAVTWDGTTLTIPVSFTVNQPGSFRTQTWSGSIVAVAVPEPSSFALFSLVGAVGLLRKRSRNRIS